MTRRRTISPFLYLLALSGVLLSCGKEPFSIPESDIPLVFRTEDNWDGSAPTKADSPAEFPVGSTLGVYGYYNDGHSGQPGEFMLNQDVVRTSSGWEYNPTKYWPTEGSLSFYAYAPHAPAAAGVTAIPYFIGLDDVAWAKTVNAQAPGSELTYSEGSSSISMAFAHKLSQLRFKFNRTGSFEEGHVVKRIKIRGEFPWAAYLDATTGEWKYEKSPYHYNTNDNGTYTSTVTIPGDDSPVSSFPIDTDESTEVVLYIMPGVTSFDVLLETDYSDEITFTINFSDPVPSTSAGQSYALNFNFMTLSNRVPLTLSVTDWVTRELSSVVGEGGYTLGNCRWTVEEWASRNPYIPVGEYSEGDFSYGPWGPTDGLGSTTGDASGGSWNYDDWGLTDDLYGTSGDLGNGNWDYSDWDGVKDLDCSTDAYKLITGIWTYDDWKELVEGILDGSTDEYGNITGEWTYDDWVNIIAGILDGATDGYLSNIGDWTYDDWVNIVGGILDGATDGYLSNVGDWTYDDWKNIVDGILDGSTGGYMNNVGVWTYDDWEDPTDGAGLDGVTGDYDNSSGGFDYDDGWDDSTGEGLDTSTGDYDSSDGDVVYDDGWDDSTDLDGTVEDDSDAGDSDGTNPDDAGDPDGEDQ